MNENPASVFRWLPLDDMEVAMLSKFSALMGAAVAAGLVAVGLWAWGAAPELVAQADRPELALWAVRSAAVAGIAAAQVLGLTFVVSAFYRRGRDGEMLRLAAGSVCTASLAAAIVLGIISR